MIQVRCSSLPRLVACAASGTPPEVRIDSPRGPADLGTAFHACMAAVCRGEEPDVEQAAAENNVDPGDLWPLVGWAKNLWRDRLAALFPEPFVEISSEAVDGDLTLTGTADLVSYADDETRILDWKSGWSDTDATEQLRGYAFLHSVMTSGAPVRVTKLQVRQGRAETLLWTREELSAWWEWLKAHLAAAGTYRPGPHCGRCPRALECPAHAKQIAGLSLALLGSDGRHLAPDDPDELANTLRLTKLVAKRCEEFQAAVKARVEASGGRLGPLALVTSERKSIDVARGMGALLEHIPWSDLKPLLKVSKGDVETAVKVTAPRGQKGATVTDLMDRLDAAGALNVTTCTQLEIQNGGDKPAIDGRPATAVAARER